MEILKKLFIKFFGKIWYLLVNNIMEKNILNEVNQIRQMMGLVNEQSNDEPKVGDQLDQLSKMKTVQQSLSEFLPILNKTTEELLDIRDKEIVNQVMNTNETNRSILNNIGGFWNSTVKGTGYEDQYEEPFAIVERLVRTQKIDGDYLPLKWLKDMLYLSKTEFKDFINRVKKSRLPDFVEEVRNSGTSKGKLMSMTPPDLKYRIEELGKALLYKDSYPGGIVPKPTGTKPPSRPTTVQRPK